MAAEPMQVDVAPEENENSPAPRILETANIDLETYAASYQGLARLNRLMHIADHCMALQIDALKMALSLVQNTLNVSYYHIIHKKLQEAINNHSRTADGANLTMPALDFHWVEATQKKASLKLERLDNDLKNYRSNSIKESIRRGNDDLGDHHLDCCELNAALKCYSRSRDYCTSPKHVVSMCLNVIKVSVYLQNWAHVISYVNKAESTPYLTESAKDVHAQQIATKLKAAAGLAELAMGRYKQAAKLFLQANFDYADFPELLSPNNIAVYGTLCALATFDRQELQKSIISSSTFKLFLELEPQLRDVVHCFYNSKYASCLKHLSDIKDNLYLDMYLITHVDRLYGLIRKKALCQYFSPYKSADLLKMASAFNCTCADLEEEVIRLILDEKINARIDSHNKILYAKDTDKRSETFEKAFEVSKEIKKRTSALIIRAAVLQNQIQVKNVQRGNQPMEMSITPGTSTNRN